MHNKIGRRGLIPRRSPSQKNRFLPTGVPLLLDRISIFSKYNRGAHSKPQLATQCKWTKRLRGHWKRMNFYFRGLKTHLALGGYNWQILPEEDLKRTANSISCLKRQYRTQKPYSRVLTTIKIQKTKSICPITELRYKLDNKKIRRRQPHRQAIINKLHRRTCDRPLPPAPNSAPHKCLSSHPDKQRHSHGWVRPTHCKELDYPRHWSARLHEPSVPWKRTKPCSPTRGSVSTTALSRLWNPSLYVNRSASRTDKNPQNLSNRQAIVPSSLPKNSHCQVRASR